MAFRWTHPRHLGRGRIRLTPASGNLFHFPDGRIVDPDTPLYDPDVIVPDPANAFADWPDDRDN